MILASLTIAAALAQSITARPEAAQVDIDTVSIARDTATISYDEYGVPYIRGTSDRAAYFGLGYATARDRLFQMHYLRLKGEGRLAEYFGPAPVDQNAANTPNELYLESDREVRYMGLARAAEARALEFASNPVFAVESDLLQAYADGVNEYVRLITNPNQTTDPRGAGSELDPMFERYGIPVVPDWSTADSILVWLSTLRTFHQSLQRDFSRLALIRNVPIAEWRMINFRTEVTINSAATIQGSAVPAATLTSLLRWQNFVGAHHVVPRFDDAPYAPKFSQALVVRGNKVDFDTSVEASNAVLIGMPRISVASPNPVYEWSVTGKSFSVRGSGIPGSPNVLFGATAAPNPTDVDFVPVTWSLTSNTSDIGDLFEIDSLDPVAQTYELEDSAVSLLESEVEVIKKRTNPGDPVPQYETEQITYQLTRFGPVITPILSVSAGDSAEFAYAFSPLRWNLPDAGPLPFVAHHRLYSTSGVGQFLNRVRSDYSFPAANLLAADAAGHIGHTVTGDVPVRRPVLDPGNPDDPTRWYAVLPMPGFAAEDDWQGFVPPAFRPRVIDPEVGYLQSANQIPVNSSYPLRNYYGGQSDTERSARLRYLMTETGFSTTGRVPFSVLSGLVSEQYRAVPDIIARLLDHTSTQLPPHQVTLTPAQSRLRSDVARWRANGAVLDGSSMISAAMMLVREEPFSIDFGNPDLVAVRNCYGGRPDGALNFLTEAVRGINTGARTNLPLAEINSLLIWAQDGFTRLARMAPPTTGPPDDADFSAFNAAYFAAGSTFSGNPENQNNSPFASIGRVTRWRDFAIRGRIDPLVSAPVEQYLDHTVGIRVPSGGSQGNVGSACYNQIAACGGTQRSDIELWSLLATGQSEKLTSHHVDDQMDLLATGGTKAAPFRDPTTVSNNDPTSAPIVLVVR